MRFLFRTVFRLARLILIPMMAMVAIAHTHEYLSPTIGVLGIAWFYTLSRLITDFKRTIRGW